MKTLLNNIKAKLIDGLPYIKAVTIIPDPAIFPSAPGFPQVGILDNGESQAPEKAMSRVEILRVQIAIYQSIVNEEASVMGDSRNKGILDIADDIDSLLRNELFDNYNVSIKNKSKSQAITADFERFVAHKTVDLEYGRARTEAIE